MIFLSRLDFFASPFASPGKRARLEYFAHELQPAMKPGTVFRLQAVIARSDRAANGPNVHAIAHSPNRN